MWCIRVWSGLPRASYFIKVRIEPLISTWNLDTNPPTLQLPETTPLLKTNFAGAPAKLHEVVFFSVIWKLNFSSRSSLEQGVFANFNETERIAGKAVRDTKIKSKIWLEIVQSGF